LTSARKRGIIKWGGTLITSPNTGLEIIMPGRQDIILFSGAPNLIVTLFPPLKSIKGFQQGRSG